MKLAKPWSGKDLSGWWDFTYKIDGIRAIHQPWGWESRKGKELYNLPIHAPCGDYEVYLGSFKRTVEVLRTKEHEHKVTLEELYSLDPLDKRLFLISICNPKESYIKELLQKVNNSGYEGLVLRQKDAWIKVKPEETYDVEVLSMGEGKGKYKGALGFFRTPMGKVGTGFTDEERKKYWAGGFTGSCIEVGCMSLTPDGKFRHPRFIRERFDK